MLSPTRMPTIRFCVRVGSCSQARPCPSTTTTPLNANCVPGVWTNCASPSTALIPASSIPVTTMTRNRLFIECLVSCLRAAPFVESAQGHPVQLSYVPPQKVKNI